MTDLKALREQLTDVDMQIIDLIHQRQLLSKKIGSIKRKAGKPTRDFLREKQVLELASNHAEKLNMQPDVIVDVMQLLIKSSLRTQEKARVQEEGQGSGQSALVIGGAGRMGNWFVEFLKSQGFDVFIADPNAKCDEVRTFASWKTPEDNFDITVVAAPLRESLIILNGILEKGRRGLIFDIGSLKSPLKKTLWQMSEKGIKITSIHPMFGPETDLLTGKHIIFMDVGSTESLQKAQRLFESTTAQQIEMSLENHDYAISYVLGLSHVLNIAFAKVLSSSGENKDLLSNLSSTTFKDQLDVAKRVTDENPHLYYEIQYLNEFSLKTISELSNAIKEIFDFIGSGDEDGFVQLMDQSRSYFSEK